MYPLVSLTRNYTSNQKHSKGNKNVGIVEQKRVKKQGTDDHTKQLRIQSPYRDLFP